MNKTIYDKIINILCETQILSADGPSDYSQDTVLLGPGGVMDSLSAMAFIAAVESEFHVDILENDADFSALESVGALMSFLEQHETPPDDVTVGWHLLVDCSHCWPEAMDTVDGIRTIVRELAAAAEVTVCQENYHTFTPVGITGVAIVSESHISVHTWPEYRYVGIDVFSCKALDIDKILNVLKRRLDCECRHRFVYRTAQA